MARPRYSAAKRAREIRKQQERARKLARKHGKAEAPSSPEVSPETPVTEEPAAGTTPEAPG